MPVSLSYNFLCLLNEMLLSAYFQMTGWWHEFQNMTNFLKFCKIFGSCFFYIICRIRGLSENCYLAKTEKTCKRPIKPRATWLKTHCHVLVEMQMEDKLLTKSELICRYFAGMPLLVMSFTRGFFFRKLLTKFKLYFRPVFWNFPDNAVLHAN